MSAKRVFDFLVALTSLVILSPIIAALMITVRFKLGSPVFFSQKRPGLKGRIFTMWKFRSMTDARDSQGQLLADSKRLTAFGSWLRATSLDELPELWNIVRGEMSLVGPRPLLVEYLEQYSEDQARRHDMRPGLTGWAQINGRNALSWDDKFKLDVWYVEHASFWLDVKIIGLTLATVIRRDGIAATGEATMPRFVRKTLPSD